MPMSDKRSPPDRLVGYLERDLSPSDTAAVTEQLAESPAARQQLDRYRQITQALSKAEPELEAFDLVGAVRNRLVQPAPPRPQVRAQRWWLYAGALAAAACAALIGGITSVGPRDEVRRKGRTAAASQRWAGVRLYRVAGTATAVPVEGVVGRRDGVLVSYTNLGPRPFDYLMVFAVDAERQVTWLYPAWERASDNPTAIAVHKGVANMELRSLIHPRWAVGPLTLRYADDDAIATHRLLTEAGVHSVLLTTSDADTQRLGGAVVADGPATWPALTAALGRWFEQLRSTADGGELLLFYSGHGDVAYGKGYVMLEDRRLTRRMLYQLLAQSPALRNHVHVIIDACKSYFLAFERGPGGERSEYPGAFIDAQVPARLANTGFMLSTSSDRDSHEWERFQAGIFSHEVRSALRGGADLDGNGRISYAELGAFLTTANAGIRNHRYRPDFAVRPPARALDAELLAWRGEVALRVPGEPGHLYVETAAGERLLDVHIGPDQLVGLHLPAARPLFIRRADDSIEYQLSETSGNLVQKFGFGNSGTYELVTSGPPPWTYVDIVFSYQEYSSTLTTNLSFIDAPRVMLNGPGTYVPIR